MTGNLANWEARALILSARLGDFDPVQMVFAWTRADNFLLMLGQVNFFMVFDVCFYRKDLAFEIKPNG